MREEWEVSDEIESSEGVAAWYDESSSYFRMLASRPLLSLEEESILSRAAGTSSQAREEFALHNLRLVISQAKKYAKNSEQFLELIQEGNIGLIKAIDKFNPDLGYKFSTYATWWVKQSIFKFFSEGEKLIPLPSSVTKVLQGKKKVYQQYLKEYSREPSEDELCKALNISKKSLNRILLVEESFDQIHSVDVTITHEDGSQMSVLDTISEDLSKSMEESIDDQIMLDNILTSMPTVLSTRELDIVQGRFGLNQSGATTNLAELAKRHNISMERVRQIEKQALDKLS